MAGTEEKHERGSRETVIVVGAGAAGLMAAGFAAASGARVVLLERTSDGGRKILISGGGRCNVLPSHASPAQYVTASSPNTLRKILLAWPLDDQKEFFEKELGIPLALERESGKLFPASNRARDVRDRLVDWNREQGVEIRFDATVRDLSRNEEQGEWHVILADGSRVTGTRVVLATGGLSVPKTGSDGIGLCIARELQHEIHPTYPALTPLTAMPTPHADIAGVSLNVHLEAPLGKGNRFETEGGFLFTHRGYSGPAILDISHLAVLSRLKGEEPQKIFVRWTELDEERWENLFRTGGGARVISTLRDKLPTRLADVIMHEAGVDPEAIFSQLRRDERRRLTELLARYPLPWTGDEGYKKAEVTGGGVALNEVDSKTLESRRHPGLFFCGEILDAFGPIGGYNFMWAWSTGRTAGLASSTLCVP